MKPNQINEPFPFGRLRSACGVMGHYHWRRTTASLYHSADNERQRHAIVNRHIPSARLQARRHDSTKNGIAQANQAIPQMKKTVSLILLGRDKVARFLERERQAFQVVWQAREKGECPYSFVELFKDVRKRIANRKNN